MSKHILVISQIFYPEQFRVNDICEEWVKRGYKVTVITGIPNYPEGKFYKGYSFFKKRTENYKGIKIIRLPIIPRGSNFITLSLNYISFVISGLFWCFFTKIKADYVFIYEGSPMTQALPGVWYAKKRKIPCYIYVTDLWPENIIAVTGIKNKYFINLIIKKVEYIYKNCQKIFVPSKAFIEPILTRKVPIEKIEYWPQYAEEFYLPINKKDVNIPDIPQDKFNIIFTGNIGIAQGLDILPKTAKILKDKNINVRFNLVGEGRYKENLIKTVQETDVIEYFNFIDKQPAKKIPEFIAVCDATLLTLENNEIYSRYIPAKIQSYLACGKPVVVSANGEVQNIIKEANAGFCCDAGDAIGLAKVIVELLSKSKEEILQIGLNGYKYSQKVFNKKTLLDKMDKYFTK